MTHWPFEVVEKDGSPLIKVHYLGEEKTFSPQEVSSMVLSKMKEISEAKLGKTVKKAVVTYAFRVHIKLANLTAMEAFLPTSMILSVLPLKTLELLQDSMFSALSTNLPLLLSLMVLIAKARQRKMS